MTDEEMLVVRLAGSLPIHEVPIDDLMAGDMIWTPEDGAMVITEVRPGPIHTICFHKDERNGFFDLNSKFGRTVRWLPRLTGTSP